MAMTWAASRHAPACSNSFLQTSLKFPSSRWKQRPVFCVAGARSGMVTMKPKRQPQQNPEKPSLFADEGSRHAANGYLGNVQAPVIDEVNDDDGPDREQNDPIRRQQLKEKLSRIFSHAQRLRKGSLSYPAPYTLGIDFGDVRTGVAISKGFAPRPVEIVSLRGQKLEARLIEIAHRERASEFVVGLPKSSKGLETSQSGKTRSFAGRLAVLAAQRGWCVYLYDEWGTSSDALDYMLMMGSTRKGRRTKLDAYAAVVLLQAYFESSGENAELVIPKKLFLQECLCQAQRTSDSDN